MSSQDLPCDKVSHDSAAHTYSSCGIAAATMLEAAGLCHWRDDARATRAAMLVVWDEGERQLHDAHFRAIVLC